MRLRVDRLCAVACLAALGCGRIGYSTVALVPADASVGDTSGDHSTGSTSDRADEPTPDSSPPDGLPPDFTGSPPDFAPDVAVDRPPDRAPDLPPDAGPPGPPRLLDSSVAIATATQNPGLTYDPGPGATVLLVSVQTKSIAPSVLSVSFAGRSLTQLARHRAGACGAAMFGLDSPPTGPGTVQVNLDTPDDVIVIAASFAGLRQPSIAEPRFTSAGTTSPAQLSAPATGGDMTVNTVCLSHAAPLVTPGAGQTPVVVRQLGLLGAGMSTRPSQQPTTYMNWTFSGGPANGWAVITVFLKPR